MRTGFIVFAAVLLGSAGITAQADQLCNANTPDETPTSRYQLNADGTASDLQTGLMWMRCLLGQTWNAADSSCEGTGTFYSWQDALLAVAALNAGTGFAGYTDWRLANLRELGSIERYQCLEPALNMEVFPTPAATVNWTATPLEAATNIAWSINFGTGHAEDRVMTTQHAIRLVRAGAFDNQIPPPATSSAANVVH